MIEQIETFDNNVLSIEVIDGFTETDQKLCEKLFQEKLNKGYDHVNMLVKLDELKLSHSSAKAFMEDMIWQFRHYKELGHLAVVAHSNIVRALVPIDNLFFLRASQGRLERYFDISQMTEAMEFVDKGNPIKIATV